MLIVVYIIYRIQLTLKLIFEKLTEQAPPPFRSFHHFLRNVANTPLSCSCKTPSLNCD